MKKLLVGLFAVAMVIAFTAPTMAAEWSFYGSARMSTFVENNDVTMTDTTTTEAGEEVVTRTWSDDQSSTTWALQGNSRIGAKVAANDNGISGRFEYGSGPNLRLLYGQWDFGGGALLLGQDYCPTTAFISNQVWAGDNDLIYYGMPYIGRQPQAKLKMGGFQLAFITPNTSLPANDTGEALATFPRTEAAYNFKTDMFFIRPYAGINVYDIEGGSDDSITSWLGGMTFGVTPGAFFFKGGAYYSLNPIEYGILTDTDIPASYVNGTVEDTHSWGFQAIVGFKASDMITIEGGVGASAYDQDDEREVTDAIDTDFDEADAVDWSYYGNASITLAPGFFIVPEVGFVDREDVGTFDNDTFYVGAKWQINF